MSQEINANTEEDLLAQISDLVKQSNLIKPVKYYAGIGSREAPSDILLIMTEIAKLLEQKGYILRSGHAQGSDMAFEDGVQLAKNKEIFSRHVATCDEARAIAASIHPAWHNCSDYAKGCHGRNIYQVLGRDLKTPVSFVICWTPEGKEIGGTRTAIVLAKRHKIPVYNLALEIPSSITDFVEKITQHA
jgi:hypothetical protein